MSESFLSEMDCDRSNFLSCPSACYQVYLTIIGFFFGAVQFPILLEYIINGLGEEGKGTQGTCCEI